MDIAHTSILGEFSPSDLVSKFEAVWRHLPEAVVIPAVNADGLLFDVDGLTPTRSASADARGGFEQILREFNELGCRVYLSISPGLRFIRSSAIQLTAASDFPTHQLIEWRKI